MNTQADPDVCEIKSFYNGACPVCGHEMRAYARYAEREGLSMGWVDIDADPDALADLGLTADALKRRMHVIDEAGTLHKSVDAFLVLWRRMPRYRWLARILGLPGFKQAFWLAYEGVIAPVIYTWDKRRMRRRAAQ